MSETNYRLSKNRDEILNALKNKFKAGSVLIIWQKCPDTNERIFLIEANFKSIDLIENTFAVDIKNEDIKKIDRFLDTGLTPIL